MTAIISMVFNFAIAAGKLVIGLATLSVYIIISAFYSLGVGLAKQIYYRGYLKALDDPSCEPKYYLRISLVLMASSLVYIGYMIRLFFIKNSFHYSMFLGIAIATVSFFELIVAIVGLVKSNRRKDLLLSGLKTVNLSSALVALVLTQIAILSFTSSGAQAVDHSFNNALFGIGMGSVSLIFSLLMALKYRRVIKSSRN